MINTLDSSHLEPLLADDFHYASQMVFEELTSKDQFMNYITGKLKTFGRASVSTRAEMAVLGHGSAGEPGPGMLVLGFVYPGMPCVVVSQGNVDEPVGTVLAEVSKGKLKRLDMCVAPHPSTAVRSGEFPGLKGILDEEWLV